MLTFLHGHSLLQPLFSSRYCPIVSWLKHAQSGPHTGRLDVFSFSRTTSGVMTGA